MFHLPIFEGPMDLLYHLIEKNEIDIYDIPIAALTEQYLEYLQRMQNVDLEHMSAFILMASELLEIKSKMLLPQKEKKEDEEDPRASLVERLVEYKKFKEVTDVLREREAYAGQVLYRVSDKTILEILKPEKKIDLEEFLGDLTVDALFQAFEEVMRRKEAKRDKIRSSFRSVEKDLFTIEDKTELLRDLLLLSPVVRFSEIFREDTSKIEIVVTFLALLELIKLKEIKISQEKAFGEIVLMGGKSE